MLKNITLTRSLQKRMLTQYKTGIAQVSPRKVLNSLILLSKHFDVLAIWATIFGARPYTLKSNSSDCNDCLSTKRLSVLFLEISWRPIKVRIAIKKMNTLCSWNWCMSKSNCFYKDLSVKVNCLVKMAFSFLYFRQDFKSWSILLKSAKKVIF